MLNSNFKSLNNVNQQITFIRHIEISLMYFREFYVINKYLQSICDVD